MIRWMLVCLGLLLVYVPSAADAQSIPKGSYRQTCDSCRISNMALVCACERNNGKRQPTFLTARECFSSRKLRSGFDIVNDNGNLQCARASSNLPPGSYRQTCRNCQADGSRLKCECRRSNGSWNKTGWWNYSKCRAVGNKNGKLYCER